MATKECRSKLQAKNFVFKFKTNVSMAVEEFIFTAPGHTEMLLEKDKLVALVNGLMKAEELIQNDYILKQFDVKISGAFHRDRFLVGKKINKTIKMEFLEIDTYNSDC